jgi:hypothetical protein
LHLAVGAATASALDRSASKGFSFEELLEEALTEISEPHEDMLERVGGSTGTTGKKGDFTVTIAPGDVGGRDACYVVEAKDRGLKLKEIRKELDDAILNRGALAAIAVFAKLEQSPCSAPFQPYGNHAIVVYDKDDRNDLALRLGCAWARWTTRRQVTDVSEGVDPEVINAQIDAARSALRAHSAISTSLKASKTKIDHALNHVATLVSDVELALDAIDAELSQGGRAG